MRGASITMASVIPVRTVMKAGMVSSGLTSVWNSPSTSPPRTLTAPNSVILDPPFGDPPVVSRSTTQNETSDSGWPRSSNVGWGMPPPSSSLRYEQGGAPSWMSVSSPLMA